MCVGSLLKPGIGQSVIATEYPVPSRLLIHRTVHTWKLLLKQVTIH